MFSYEFNGYNRSEVNAFIVRLKDTYEKTLMEERLKVLEAERKIMEYRNREKELQEKENNVNSLIDTLKKFQQEDNVELLRVEQLRLIYIQVQEFMQQLNAKYPGVILNGSYKKLLEDIQEVLAKTAKREKIAGSNDSMRFLLSKMKEKKGHEHVKEVRVERNYDFKEKMKIKPVTEMHLEQDDQYESLVDKFLASKPVEEQPKAMPIVSSGFDLKEAVTPTEDLSEIMKAFDFFNEDNED